MSRGVPEHGRVYSPIAFPRERVVVAELHLVRTRLDSVLDELSQLACSESLDEAWLRVEEAVRLARRALGAATAAAPPLPPSTPAEGELVVGRLRVDTVARRQWYGDREVVLTPLHHQLLAVMAAEPFRVFGKDELLRAVWRRGGATAAVNTSVSRIRRALVAAGAPVSSVMLSVHGVGWALTRPD